MKIRHNLFERKREDINMSVSLNPKSSFDLCVDCSVEVLKNWKGWPITDKTPILPIMFEGKCPVCKGSNAISSLHLVWMNIHGEYSTGLPKYWVIYIPGQGADISGAFSHWGFPYYDLVICPKCGSNALISQHSSGQNQEFLTQCTSCNYVKRI